MPPLSFLDELKRRKVGRVAVVYGAAAFAVLQAADIMLPQLGAPDWAMRAVVVLAVVGFPLALVLGWVLDLGPGGVRITKDADDEEERQPPSLLGRSTLFIAAALVVLGLGIGTGWFLKPTTPGSVSDGTPVVDAFEAQSVAVLPFVPQSAGADDGYFADGLTEEILNALAALPDLLVTARTSSFQFKRTEQPLPQVAERLGVAHVLEGSVRRSDDRVVVTAQLVRAGDGFGVWSGRYDGPVDDLFAIQRAIAEKVAEELGVILDPERKALMEAASLHNVDAFVAFLKGRELFDEAHTGGPLVATLVRADEWFEQATELAPGFWVANAWASDLYAHILMDEAAGETVEDAPLEMRQEAAARLIGALTQAHEHAPNRGTRDHIDLVIRAFSDDWTGLRSQVGQVYNGRLACGLDLWSHLFGAPYGEGEAALGFFEAGIRCNRLSHYNWVHASKAAMWLRQPAVALELIEEGMRVTDPWTGMDLVRMQALLALGRIEEARGTLAIPRSPPEAALAELTLHASVGDRQAAEAVAARWRVEPGTSDADELLIAALLGDRGTANAAAARIDARPLGPTLLAIQIYFCACGAPFDLEAAPRFAEQLEASGLRWPPLSWYDFPLKTW